MSSLPEMWNAMECPDRGIQAGAEAEFLEAISVQVKAGALRMNSSWGEYTKQTALNGSLGNLKL